MFAKTALSGLLALGLAGVANAQEPMEPVEPMEVEPLEQPREREIERPGEMGQPQGQQQGQQLGQEGQQFGQQQQGQIPEHLWFSLTDFSVEQFNDARDKLKDEKFEAAAMKLQSVYDYLGLVEQRGTQDTQGIQQARQQLQGVIDQVRQKQITEVDRLEPVFATVANSLARYYHSEAQQAVQGQQGLAAGFYLRAAGNHVKHAAKWSDVDLEGDAKDSIKLTDRVGGELIDNPNTIPQDAQKALTGIQQAIQQVDQKVQKPEPAGAT